MKDKYLLAAVLSSVFSSVSILFYAVAVRELNPFLSAASLYILGGSLFVTFLFITKKYNIQNLKKNKRDIAIVSIFRGSTAPLIVAVGLTLTQSIKVIFFTKIEPYFVLVIGWLSGEERIYKKQLALLAFHLFGAFLLSTSGNLAVIGKAQIGDALVIAAMLLFALSYAYSTRLSKNVGAVQSNGFTSLIGGLILLPLVLYFPATNPYSIKGWLHFLVAFVLFNIFALTLWFYSLQRVKGWIVSAVRAIGPVAAAPFAFFLFGETLNTIQILGAGLVLITSFLITREHKTV